MKFSRQCALIGSVAAHVAALGSPRLLPYPLSIPQLASSESTAIGAQREDSAKSTVKVYNFSLPLDHFHNDSSYEPHTRESFNLRYWLDVSNYKPGGPVIVLAAGETDGTDRLPFIEHGILPILTKATGGVALVLEHRYYGTSFPSSFTNTNEDLRFLSTEQALADTAYFAQHITFPGLDHVNLTAPNAPWIIYGGSYAGAFAALARKIYPDVYWGAISSSGVTEAIEEYWQYFEAFRIFAPGDCGSTVQKVTHVFDTVLFSEDQEKIKNLKDIFGLAELSNPDFGAALTVGISGLQNTMWDPSEDSASLGLFCGTVTSELLLFSSTSYLRDTVQQLVLEAGYEAEKDALTARILNYIGYARNSISKTLRSECKGRSVLECLSAEHVKDPRTPGTYPGLEVCWTWQTCKQWGYFVTGSGVPKDQLSVISRTIDLKHASSLCSRWFNITTPPDLDSINKYGGFGFSYPRLAIIDGRQDPWRAATPHAIGQPERKSTISEPYILIDPGVHHWDEYGLRDSDKRPGFPPKQIVDAQNQEAEFVQAWVKEWHQEQSKQNSKFEQDGEL